MTHEQITFMQRYNKAALVEKSMIPNSDIAFDPAPAITSHLLVSSSPKRFSITFFPPNTGFYTLSNEPNVAPTQGLNMNAGQGAITLNIRDHGSCVQKDWFVISSAVGAVPGWIDALL